jgi:hypothetical protein
MKKAQMENVLEKYRYRRTDRLQGSFIRLVVSVVAA